MVKSETTKLMASKGRKKEKMQQEKEFEIKVLDYGDSQVEGTNVVVAVCVATFTLKKEDRHQVLRVGDDAKFRNCQIKLDCEPMLSAFVGVFDGHDGDACSEYCHKGLLPHIIAEQSIRCAQQPTPHTWFSAVDRANAPLKVAADNSSGKDSPKMDMEIPFVAAFKKCQERFANKFDPPTFDEVSKIQTVPLKIAPPGSYNPMQWVSGMTASVDIQRGGTTACTMGLFTEAGEGSARTVIPTVVVANTGDSRLVTDDASGTSNFRQVTTDHRPDEPKEKKRLTDCVARGEATLHRSTENHDVRVHPGGLAVSRTIGDMAASKGIICTPEVVHVPLNISTEKGKPRTQRFVLASDGLWDVTDNDAVGKAAARKVSSSSTASSRKPVSTREAAEKIMQKCLDCGGSRDDITICVVDVGYL